MFTLISSEVAICCYGLCKDIIKLSCMKENEKHEEKLIIFKM